MSTLCWIARHPNETAADAERHYPTKEQARDVSAAGTIVEQLTTPCITVTCKGCDYTVDEDFDGVIHFESAEQARAWVLGNLDGAVFDGDVLTRCHADCPGRDNDGAQDRGDL